MKVFICNNCTDKRGMERTTCRNASPNGNETYAQMTQRSEKVLEVCEEKGLPGGRQIQDCYDILVNGVAASWNDPVSRAANVEVLLMRLRAPSLRPPTGSTAPAATAAAAAAASSSTSAGATRNRGSVGSRSNSFAYNSRDGSPAGRPTSGGFGEVGSPPSDSHDVFRALLGQRQPPGWRYSFAGARCRRRGRIRIFMRYKSVDVHASDAFGMSLEDKIHAQQQGDPNANVAVREGNTADPSPMLGYARLPPTCSIASGGAFPPRCAQRNKYQPIPWSRRDPRHKGRTAPRPYAMLHRSWPLPLPPRPRHSTAAASCWAYH